MNLMSLKQTAEQYPAFTVAALRWQLHKRSTNGLDRATVRIGRRVYIDADAFDNWIQEHRES